MPASLLKLIEGATLDEVEFLERLTEKFPPVEYAFHYKEMTLQEMDRLLDLLGKKRNLTLKPTPWVYGCAYEIAHINIDASPRYEVLFGAKEDLWPKIGMPGDNKNRFDFLARWFMRDSNIELIRVTGQDVPVNNYYRFNY